MSQSGGGSLPVYNQGPLEGVRVVELGSLVAGPFAGRLLGDFGAEVIKIESPDEPDLMRQWGAHRFRGRALVWPIQSRNKKCITLNLRQAEGQELFRRLIAKSDILLENFRPGTMEKWGLGWDALSALNPALIMTRVSGFGQSGPYKDRTGFGSVGEAIGGLRYLMGYPDRPPVRAGIALGDSLAALFATVGTLAALDHRRKSGRGQMVDCAINEAVFSLLESILPEYDLLGVVRERTGATLPKVAPSNIYPTSDGKMLLIAANQDGIFRRLAQVMGQPELADDPRYATHEARGERQAELDEIITAWTVTREMHELWKMLNDAAVPAGPIYSIADIAHDAQFHARGMIRTVDDPEIGALKMPGIVPQLSETPGVINWTGPATPGSHNREIYGELLGVSEQELERLSKAGIV
ncbi:MAG TPA: CoA transferase [Candidatus Binataceae bacterium]|nr:CoA transferase [Candidatus Binataceae bacterium]